MPDHQSIVIFVDADACPVKAEVYRVAERHRIDVAVVANSFMAVPNESWIERVIVSAGFDAAPVPTADGKALVAADRSGGQSGYASSGTAQNVVPQRNRSTRGAGKVAPAS